MGRTFKRKTPKVSEGALRNAIEAVKNGTGIRTAARNFNVPKTTLRRRVKSAEPQKKHSMQVFTNDQETALKKYLLRNAGMSLKATCILAYQYAQTMHIKMPKSWQDNKMAGIEWWRTFRKRHLALTPQAICAGFESTGIRPLNEEKFTAIDFAAAVVSDRDTFDYDPQQDEIEIKVEMTDEIIGSKDPLDSMDSLDGDDAASNEVSDASENELTKFQCAETTGSGAKLVKILPTPKLGPTRNKGKRMARSNGTQANSIAGPSGVKRKGRPIKKAKTATHLSISNDSDNNQTQECDEPLSDRQRSALRR